MITQSHFAHIWHGICCDFRLIFGRRVTPATVAKVQSTYLNAPDRKGESSSRLLILIDSY